MKRSGALFAALVVISVWIAGCSSVPTPEQIAEKQAFIRQLIGFCGEVNRQLANIEATAQPGIWADQFALFAAQARRQPPPILDQEQFKIMLTKIDITVGQFRWAQATKARGDQPNTNVALAQAERDLKRADAAAQKYGMPPLNSCPHESGTSSHAPDPSAVPPPGAAWQPRDEASVAVQQVNATELDGRIWVAGGVTASHEATASTQFYDPAINNWGWVRPARGAAPRDGGELPQPAGGHRRVPTRDNDLLGVTSPRMLLLDNNTSKFVDGKALLHPRGAGGAAVVGNEIVVVGGRTGNPRSWSPRPRSSMAPSGASAPTSRCPATTSPSPPTPGTCTRSAAASSPPTATSTSCNAMTRKPTIGTS